MFNPRQLNTRLLHWGKLILLLTVMTYNNNVAAQDTAADGDSVPSETKKVPTQIDGVEEEEHFLQNWENREDEPTLHERHVPAGQVKKLQRDDDFWYANAMIRKVKARQKAETSMPLVKRIWFQTLLWLIIIASFAGVLIWYLADSNVGLFRKKNKMIESDVALQDDQDIFNINYQLEIDKAIQQKNYRLAIRLMFLRMLKDLSEKKIIQYTQDKTNFDYLMQLHSTRYYDGFFRIARNYEFSWYGQFEVNENAFRIIQGDFNQFNNQWR